MRVWVDVANAPHVRLLAPLVEQLRGRGDSVLVTVRDHRETAALARQVWPDVEPDGGSSPDSRLGKAVALAGRVAHLARRARSFGAEVAVGHNSYAQIVAARLIRIPSVTAMDYEHQPANHLAFRLASRVIVPERFPAEALRRFGARAGTVVRYRGLKEEVYLRDTVPVAGERERIGVADGSRFAVLRLPPDGALYHRNGNDLVREAVAVLRDRGLIVVVLARSVEQRTAWRARADERLIVPEPPVDTMSLLADAALFVGAGGTMTREAALLGVPTWSIFAGRRAAVDEWLAQQGRLVIVDSAMLRSLPIDARREIAALEGDLLRVLVEAVEEARGG